MLKIKTKEEFRETLTKLGHTQASFARLLAELGDDRKPQTIARYVRKIATGETQVSTEMCVILNLLWKIQQG